MPGLAPTTAEAALPAGIPAAAAASLALRVGSLLLLFLAQLLLTRTLGVAEFGAFAFALAWVKALGIAATLGAERLIVRDAAAHAVRREWRALRQFVRWLARTLLASAVAVAAAAALIFWVAAPDASWLPVVWIALALLPLTAAMRIAQYVLAGLQRPLVAQLAETIVQPLLFLCGAAALALSGTLAAASGMAVQLAAAALAAALGIALLMRSLPPARAAEAPPAPGTNLRWRSVSAMFVASASMTLLAAAPMLLLGMMSGPAEAGIMAVVRSLADLTLVPVLAFGSVMGPLLGRLAAEGDKAALQRSFTAFARRSSLAMLPIAAGLFLLREPLLGLFGEAFTAGAAALSILLVGQVAGVLAGSNALLLSMLGHERAVALVSAGCLIAGSVAIALLIPPFGVAGAAVGAACASILWNLLLSAATRRLAGLRPGAFPAVR